MTSKVDKLPLETEPVARDNNTILTLKRGGQTLSRLTQLIIVVSLFTLKRFLQDRSSSDIQMSTKSHLVAHSGLSFSFNSNSTKHHIEQRPVLLPSLPVADPDIELRGGGGGAVLIYLPCRPFSLQSLLLFLPKIRRGGGGGAAPPLDPPLSSFI